MILHMSHLLSFSKPHHWYIPPSGDFDEIQENSCNVLSVCWTPHLIAGHLGRLATSDHIKQDSHSAFIECFHTTIQNRNSEDQK